MSLVFDCNDPVERAEGIDTAVDSIRRGELVVMPVDASYGVAADAFQPAAVDALSASKGRGRDMPIPVMVGSWSGLDGLTLMVQPEVRALVEAFWPGPLTLVIEHAPSLAWDLGDERHAVSIRMPIHPIALELLARTGPLAVSGANLAGKRVALTAGDAQEQFGYAVAVYLDGGMCIDPAPSTIVDVTGPEPVMLRRGQVSLSQLKEVVPEVVERDRRQPAG